MRIAIVTGLILISALGNARTFDCSNPKLTAEFVICGDAELQKTADQRQRAWTEAKARAGGEQRSALLEDQRQWLRNYPRACGITGEGKPSAPIASSIIECFKRASEGRAAYLSSYRPAVSPAPPKKAAAGAPAAAKDFHMQFTFACRGPERLSEVLRSVARNDYTYALSQADCLPVPEGRHAILLSLKGDIAKIRLCSEEAGCTDVHVDASKVIDGAGRAAGKSIRHRDAARAQGPSD
jgi:uncharacterized protein YecT (DUF1311 family)